MDSIEKVLSLLSQRRHEGTDHTTHKPLQNTATTAINAAVMYNSSIDCIDSALQCGYRYLPERTRGQKLQFQDLTGERHPPCCGRWFMLSTNQILHALQCCRWLMPLRCNVRAPAACHFIRNNGRGRMKKRVDRRLVLYHTAIAGSLVTQLSRSWNSGDGEWTACRRCDRVHFPLLCKLLHGVQPEFF